MTANNELVRMCNETLETLFEMLSRHFTDGGEKKSI